MIGKIEANNVNFWYGDFHALKGISMSIEERSVVAFIGPSGCGKSTFLRLFNRMNDLIPNTRLTGEIHIDGKDIYGKDVQVDELRKKVGMVFQRPNPFPKSIFENVAYIMAYHADHSIPATIEDWLDEFEMFSIYEVLPEILELWGMNLQTEIESKKNFIAVAGK